MPRYRLTSPEGRTIIVSGDTPPTEEDAANIFARAAEESMPLRVSREKAPTVPEELSDLQPDQAKRILREREKEATLPSKAIRGAAGLVGIKYAPYSEALEKQYRGGEPAYKELLRTASQTAAKTAPMVIPAGGVARIIPRLVAGSGGVGAGEILSETIKGTPIKEALKKGVQAAAITGVAGAAAGGLGKAVSTIPRSIIKKSIAPQFAESVVDDVLVDVGLTKAPRESFARIAKFGRKALKGQEKSYGRLVGAAKARAIADDLSVNIGDVRRSAREVMQKYKFGVPAGKVKAESSRMNVVKGVLNQLKGDKNITPEDALTKLQNIDDKLASTYTRLDRGESITTAERAALKIRGTLKDNLNKTLGKSFEESKLPFIKISNLMDAQGGAIRRGLANRDKTQNMIKKAFKEGNDELLTNLKELDRLLPEKRKFLKKAMQKAVSEEISRSARLLPGTRIEGLYDMLAGISAGALRTGKAIQPATSKARDIVPRIIGSQI